MKLIDILVQELPKRGGWPDGIEEIWQDYDKLIRAGAFGWFHDVLSEDHRRQHYDAHVKVNRKQYEAALAASKVPVWDGEGAPPVGCRCERNYYDRSGDDWREVTILFWGRRVAVVEANGKEAVANSSSGNFRPIRPEAERKREETVNAIQQKLICRNEVAVDFYEYLAAGKIPGIRLTDDAGSQ